MTPSADQAGAVLVVEDDVFIMMDTVTTFEDAGLNVIGALNADAALRILEARSDITVLVTDVEMPGSMNGVLLAAVVRDRWPPVKLIVVSGHRRIEPRELPDDARFIAKPYDTRALSALVLSLAQPTLH